MLGTGSKYPESSLRPREILKNKKQKQNTQDKTYEHKSRVDLRAKMKGRGETKAVDTKRSKHWSCAPHCRDD